MVPCNWCQSETDEHYAHCQAPKIDFDENGEPQYWTIRLNKYQRDNLVWLFNAIGYPGSADGGVAPFTLANTGDWVGEVPNMLAKPGKSAVLDENDRPNKTMDDLRADIERWVVAAKVHLT